MWQWSSARWRYRNRFRRGGARDATVTAGRTPGSERETVVSTVATSSRGKPEEGHDPGEIPHERECVNRPVSACTHSPPPPCALSAPRPEVASVAVHVFADSQRLYLRRQTCRKRHSGIASLVHPRRCYFAYLAHNNKSANRIKRIQNRYIASNGVSR